MTNPTGEEKWVDAISVDELEAKGRSVFKTDGKQILIASSDGKIFACNNRCPHEGYPLSEGTISGGCVLTCNWHNWKFDVENGETLYGGDQLRLYPIRIEGQTIQVDIADPPTEAIRERALTGLRQAYDEHDYARIAREVARYELAGGNPLDCIEQALAWAMDSSESGTTHAQGAAADWLSLRNNLGGDRESDRLVPVVEIIGHLSWDALQETGPFTFADGRADAFDPNALETAIEREDQTAAVQMARAGLQDNGPETLRHPLQRASLKHYQSFGHAPIFVDKTFELMGHLGPDAHEPLILPLVRLLCMGQREDLIPEFRAYGPAVEAWDGKGMDLPSAQDFRSAGVKQCMQLISGASGRIPELVDVLYEAASDAMLHFDPAFRHHTDKTIQQNIDWLDFTHALTHLNAVKKICRDDPSLWPGALLQTGCFLGRNTGYVDWSADQSEWQVDDFDRLTETILEHMLDHGEPVYIFPAHTLKLTSALAEDRRSEPAAPWQKTAFAALNRYFNEPMKRKHARRTARQASAFVRTQGL